MSHEIWTGFAELQREVHEYAIKQGFWEEDELVGQSRDYLIRTGLRHCIDSEKIALMHSELSEALDALRDGDMDQVEMELTDCVIRIADYMEQRGLHLNRGYNRVREKSKTRPCKHGRNW